MGKRTFAALHGGPGRRGFRGSRTVVVEDRGCGCADGGCGVVT